VLAFLSRVFDVVFRFAPLISFTLCAFVLATIVQEFWRGTAVRIGHKKESVLVAFWTLVSRARRRYGGYVVHVGIVLMYLGFTGSAYDVEEEAAVRPGAAMSIAGYEVRYDRARSEDDGAKRMIFTDMTVMRDGAVVGTVAPAKFIYRTHPEMPTTEVSILRSLREDVYVIMSTVDPETRLGTFKVIVRPLVNWIWIGMFVMLVGAAIAVMPTIREMLGEETSISPRRGAAAASALLLLVVGVAGAPSPAAREGRDPRGDPSGGSAGVEP
jgi:cytochrome c-type biogenesis protein CcmF